MGIKSKLEEQRASLKLNMLAGFREIPKVDIPEIPLTRELFPESTTDYWYRLATPMDADMSVCIYELSAGGVFEPHVHPFNTEQCVLLTRGAKLEVITEKEIKNIEFPNSCFFEKNEKHAVINKSDFTVHLLVVWKPKMLKGFELEYINKKDD